MARNSKSRYTVCADRTSKINGMVLFDSLRIRDLSHIRLFLKKMLERSSGVEGLSFGIVNVNGESISCQSFKSLKVNEETGTILISSDSVLSSGGWQIAWDGEYITKEIISGVFGSGDPRFLKKVENLRGDFALAAFERRNPEKIYLYNGGKPLFAVFSLQWNCVFFSAYKENMITDDDVLTLRPLIPIDIPESSALIVNRASLTRAIRK